MSTTQEPSPGTVGASVRGIQPDQTIDNEVDERRVEVCVRCGREHACVFGVYCEAGHGTAATVPSPRSALVLVLIGSIQTVYQHLPPCPARARPPGVRGNAAVPRLQQSLPR